MAEEIVPKGIAPLPHYPEVPDELKNKFLQMHVELDTIVSTFKLYNPQKGLGQTSILDLMNWVYSQTQDPKEPPPTVMSAIKTGGK